MKKFLLTLAVAATASLVSLAQSATFVAPGFTGKEGVKLVNKDGSNTQNGSTDEASSLNGQTFTSGDVTIAFAHGTGGNYTGAYDTQVRWYQGEIINVTAAAGKKITKIFVQTVANSKGNFTATVDGTTVGTVTGEGTGATTPITWEGEVTGTLTLTTVKQVRFSYMEVYLDGEGSTTPTVATLYSNSLTKGLDEFTIENISNPDGLNYIWTSSSSYGAVATAYVNNASHAAEALLISPKFVLTGASDVTVQFEHAVNKFASIETAAEQATVLVREEGGQWQTLPGYEMPTALGWNFIASGEVSLSAWIGKTIEIGFRYISNGESAGTWEIQNLVVKANGGSVILPEKPTVEVANIAAFLDKAELQANTAITSPVTAIYQNGRYLYVKDSTGSLLVYGDLNTKYSNGQTIPAGITGRYQNFSNGQLQMSNPVADTFLAGTDGTAVEPEELACEEISADLVNSYIMITDVTIAATDDANTYTITDATGSAQLYNQFSNAQYYDVVNIPTGSGLTIKGVVAVHDGKPQIVPFVITSASGKEIVETPTFSVEPGTVMAGTQVTITCGTAGAEILYRVGNGSWTTYTEPYVVTTDVTLTAYAKAEGMEDSAEATASYFVMTIPAPVGTEATFDFSDPASLNPVQEVPDLTNQSVYVGGKTFQSNGVTAYIDDSQVSQASRKARLYCATNQAGENLGVDLRIYTDSKIVMTVPTAGWTIEKVEFTSPNNSATSSTITPSTGTIDAGIWTAEQGAAPQTVTFSIIATARIAKMVVTLAQGAGVNDVITDSNAPVEYFSLQGVRIDADKLTPGLYIRRQGASASKILVK